MEKKLDFARWLVSLPAYQEIKARAEQHNPCDCVACIDPQSDLRTVLRHIEKAASAPAAGGQ